MFHFLPYIYPLRTYINVFVKILLYIAWILFGIGLTFKFMHIPGGAVLMLLATVLLAIHYVVFAFTEGKKDHSKSFLHSSFTLWTIYLLFRIQYWPVGPYIGSFSVLFILNCICTITCFILHLKRNIYFTSSLLALLVYLLFSTILSFTPSYKIFYFIYLNEISNVKTRNSDYLAWDKYSWFLYISNKHEEASDANSKAQMALTEYLKISNDIEAIQYMPQIEHHKQLIKNKNWTTFP